MDEQEEARRLVEAFQGRVPELLAFLSGQLSVLKNHAHMMMGLAGLTVTVTGFSGHLIVRAGPWAWGPMVAGIGATLLAILLTLRVMLGLHWVSEDLRDDLVATAAATIRRRNGQQQGLRLAGACLALGLSGYLLAVVASAFANG